MANLAGVGGSVFRVEKVSVKETRTRPWKALSNKSEGPVAVSSL